MQVIWSGFQRLNEDNVRKYVPRDAGVYLLWMKLKNAKWRCYYVGQTDDFERRLLDHCNLNEQNDCIWDNVQHYISGFEYAEVGRQVDRDGIEKFLYDHYKPECNKQDPGGIPIQINLP